MEGRDSVAVAHLALLGLKIQGRISDCIQKIKSSIYMLLFRCCQAVGGSCRLQAQQAVRQPEDAVGGRFRRSMEGTGIWILTEQTKI